MWAGTQVQRQQTAIAQSPHLNRLRVLKEVNTLSNDTEAKTSVPVWRKGSSAGRMEGPGSSEDASLHCGREKGTLANYGPDDGAGVIVEDREEEERLKREEQGAAAEGRTSGTRSKAGAPMREERTGTRAEAAEEAWMPAPSDLCSGEHVSAGCAMGDSMSDLFRAMPFLF